MPRFGPDGLQMMDRFGMVELRLYQQSHFSDHISVEPSRGIEAKWTLGRGSGQVSLL